MYKKFPSRDNFKQQQVHDKKQNIIELPNFWKHYNCKGFRPHNNKNIIVSTTIEKELSFDYFLSNNNNNNLQQVSELGLIHYTMANQQVRQSKFGILL